MSASHAPTVIDWLQLVAPFMAAGFGLFWYKNQKKIDRGEQLHSEKREVYRQYINSTNDVFIFSMRKKQEESRSSYDELLHVVTDLLLYGTDLVARTGKDYTDSLKEYRNITFNISQKERDPKAWRVKRNAAFSAAKASRNEMIAVLRADLMEISISDAKSIVGSYFKDQQQEELEK